MYHFVGSKSGGKSTPDTLFSEDLVEVVLAISEGPINGLEKGAKSFLVGNTPLRAPDNSPNFKDFTCDLYKGTALGQDIKPLLGGFGSSVDVNTSLGYNVPVVRQGTKTDIDYIEIRLVVQALYKETDEGTEKSSVEVKIEARKENESTWKPVTATTVIPKVNDDTKQSDNSFDENSASFSFGGRGFRHWWTTDEPKVGDGKITISSEQKTYRPVNDFYPDKQFQGDSGDAGGGRNQGTPSEQSDAPVFKPAYYTWFKKGENNKPYWLIQTITTTRKTVENETGYLTTYDFQPAPDAKMTTADGYKKWEWSAGGTYWQENKSRVRIPGVERRVFFDVTKPSKMRPENGDLWLRLTENNVEQILWYNGSTWVIPADADGDVPPDGEEGGVYPDGIIKISGKASAPMVKEVRFSVPRGPDLYQIRVTKLTKESSKVRNEISWESFQEINLDPINHPNLAIVHVTGRATDQFNQIPEFSGIYEGRVVKVPSNYDPKTRVYSGAWDGTWKLAYTNNPAYITKDLVENTRYGLSSYYPVTLDSNDVYEAGQWCDIPVDNGSGGTRPRCTFNGLIAEPRPTKEAITYICGTFGGRFFDDGNGFARIKIDKDDPAVAIFTPENVVDGIFAYSMTANEERYNDITVEYTEIDYDWENNRRRVFDQDDIDQRGRVSTDFVAVGCTDLNEALARARYKLITGLTEKTFVNFKTNREGLYLSPYDVILVADEDMDFGLSGRVKEVVSSTQIALRDPVYLEGGLTYKVKFSVVENGTGHMGIQERTVHASSTGFATTSLTFTSALPAEVAADHPFTIEASDVGVPKAFRVLTITEEEGDPDKVAITAIEVNRLKWSQVDGGANVVTGPGRIDTPLTPVTGFLAFAEKQFAGTKPIYTIVLTWNKHPAKTVSRYDLWYQYNGGQWQQLGVGSQTTYEIPGALPGNYLFKIEAVADNGRSTSVFHSYQLTGDIRTVAGIDSIKLDNGLDAENFEVTAPTFSWVDSEKDGLHSHYQVEILDPDTDAVLRTEITTDTKFTYDYLDSQADGQGEPLRRFKIQVRVVDTFANESEPLGITVQNPSPDAPAASAWSVVAVPSAIIINVDPAPLNDYRGVVVHVSTTPNFTPSAETKVYQGTNTNISHKLDAAGTYYVRVAHYDVYGSTDLNYSLPKSVVVAVSAEADTTPPGLVTNLQAEPMALGAMLTWTNPTDQDLSHCEVFRNTSNTFGTAKYAGMMPGDGMIVSGLEAGTQYWFWVRAVDVSGNRGEVATPVTATPRKLIGEEIADAVIKNIHLIDEAVTREKIAQAAVDTEHLVPDAVDGTILQADAVGAIHIGAQQVNAKHMVLTDFTNLILDADLQAFDTWGGSKAGGTWEILTNAGIGDGRRFISMSAPTAAEGFVGDARTPPSIVEPGKPYWFSARLRQSGGFVGRWGLYAYFFDATGAEITSAVTLIGEYNATTPIALAEKTVTAMVTAPANAVTMVARLRRAGNTGFPAAGDVQAWNIAIRRAVNAELIVDGGIQTNHLAANSVQIKHVVVTDWSNLIPQSDLSAIASFSLADDLDRWWVEVGVAPISAWTVVQNAQTTGHPAIRFDGAFTATTGSTYLGSITTDEFPVEAGRAYAFGVTIDPANAATGTAQAQLFAYDHTGALVDTSTLHGVLDGVTGSAQTLSGIATMPATAVKARLRFRRGASANGGSAQGTVDFRQFWVRRAAAGELIVDGSISTLKLAAGSVTAEKIGADQVNATHINVTSLSALSANLGTVTAGIIRSTNGNGFEINLNNGTITYPDGSVQTSAIANNAVSDQVVASGTATIALTTSNQTVGSVSLNVAAGQQVRIEFCYYFSASGGSSAYMARPYISIHRNGSSIRAFTHNHHVGESGAAHTFVVTGSYIDTPGAGNHTYSIILERITGGVATTSCSVSIRMLAATLLKK